MKSKEIFLKSTTTAEIVRKLYDNYSQEHRSPSLENFARSLQIPTKGQLSKILNGNLVISENHINKISNYFQISEEEKSLFLLMSKVERKKKKIIEINLEDEIERMKKIISIDSIDNFSCPSILIFLIVNIVYTKKEVNKNSLFSYLKEFSEQRIDFILDQMIRKKILKFNKFNNFVTGENINFYLNFKELSNHDLVNYIEEATKFIGLNWSEQHQSNDISFFETSSITVNKEKYIQWLNDLRIKINNELADVQEDEEPEEVISFNLQIFPLKV